MNEQLWLCYKYSMLVQNALGALNRNENFTYKVTALVCM